MEPDITKHEMQSIQEYSQNNSVMEGNRDYQGSQWGWSQTTSAVARSMFSGRGTDNPVLEWKIFQIPKTRIAYMKNGQPIWIKGVKVSIRKHYEEKIH